MKKTHHDLEVEAWRHLMKGPLTGKQRPLLDIARGRP